MAKKIDVDKLPGIERMVSREEDSPTPAEETELAKEEAWQESQARAEAFDRAVERDSKVIHK